MAGSADQPFHFRAIGASFATQSSTSAFLKLENFRAELVSTAALLWPDQRRVDADEVVSLWPGLYPFSSEGTVPIVWPCGSCRDGLGIVGSD